MYDYRGNLTLNERYFDELLMQNGKVRRLQHADGYISLTQDGNPVEYFYYLKDHLGNIRATITQATPDSLLITQANDYYPFGMAYTPKLTGLQPDSWNNKFKYNGKEEQEMPGGWLDYGARMYDPTLGRWHVVDPMSEASHNLSYSPYNYVVNNPIVLVDPDGMDWFYNDQTGAIVYVSNLRQGAEEHMEEGWQWMGANNMFTDDDPESNDMALLMGNQESGNVSFTQNDEEGGHTLSAYFDGNNAKSFMSDRGYDLLPTQQTIYERKSLFRPIHGKGNLVNDEEVRITERFGYFKMGFKEYSRTLITDPMFNLNTEAYSFEVVARWKIKYTNNTLLKRWVKLQEYLNMNPSDVNTGGKVVKTWSDFKNTDHLIRIFGEEYGTD